MITRAIFGINVLLSFAGSILVARLYVWPWLRAQPRDRALAALVAPHVLLRFLGLSFLVVGVVAPSLPATFAVPAAGGDLVAGLLAMGAATALAMRARWATGVVWLFNLWGAADLLLAFVQGPRSQLRPGDLGAAYFIPTALVPALLVSHALVFGLLLRRPGATGAGAGASAAGLGAEEPARPGR